MGKTIQEMLADKRSHGDTQPVQYLDTVEAYDKWAEVRTRRAPCFARFSRLALIN